MVWTWLLTAFASGISCGLLGLYLVGLEMPFLGIAIAHAALAGAVIAYLVQLPVWLCAGAAAILSALALARLSQSRARADLSALTSVLLSFTMGVAFLGIGLIRGEMSPVFGLLWGNILFVRPYEAIALALASGVLCLFLFVSHRLLDALLFARRSELYPFSSKTVFVVFMLIAAVLITANLQFVGGLLIYALLTNPGAAAYEVAENMTQARWYAAAFGVLSTVGGFAISWFCDLPTGASIVLLSTLVYAYALSRRLWRRHTVY